MREKQPTFGKRKNNYTYLILFFAIFLIISISNLHAQGPNAPEAASFEPVDATDMVNLVTGDFSYVLPLLEVPSPEGGYPIVLSYHAGIAMDQEASWVGLGWSLNPGTINRNVNGYADDWNDGKTSSILYDAGGETRSFSISHSVGIDGFGSVGRTLSYSENRTQGGETQYNFNVDYFASFGIKGTPIGMTASIGTSGIGLGANLNLSKSINTKKGKEIAEYGINGGINFFQSFQTGKSNFSSNLTGSIKKDALEFSFSSSRGAKFSAGGFSGFSTSGTENETNNIVYDNIDISLPIPIGISITTLGYERSRYYLFDNQYNSCYGSLYQGNFKLGRSSYLNPNKVLSDNSESIYKIDKELQQREENNIGIISKDSYRVTGQGISGSISPGFYDGPSKIMKNIPLSTNYYGDSKLSSNNLNDPTKDIYFDFENTFSSYLRLKTGSWNLPTTSISNIADINVIGRSLESTVNIEGKIETGYNSEKKRKRNGHYVEVFTNLEITSSNIIEVNSNSGFDRGALKSDNRTKDGIGAYRITALDGKVYHYSLPVYQKEKFTRYSQLDNDDELRFQENLSITPYATHWLLTAITGSDYVDVNSDGKLDKGDYGYWVEFDYGKWSDGFVWSSPSNELISNTNKTNLTYYKDINTKSYSWGVRDIYYLDKIKTRTHSALFIKGVRSDNTSTEVDINDTSYKSRQLGNAQSINGVIYLQGFESSTYNWSNYNLNELRYAEGDFDYSVNLEQQKTLCLKEILLIKNDDLENPISKDNPEKFSKSIGNIEISQENKFYDISNNEIGSEDLFEINNSYVGENYDYIFDLNDISSNIRTISQKSIQFNYESGSSLASNTPNSTLGKLSLRTLYFLSKGKALIPPYKFSYGGNFNYDYDKRDLWGYYKDKPEAWSLNKIILPSGGFIKVNYESDDYDEELFGKYETYSNNFQFLFSEENGKLRIEVQNENGTTMPIDFTKRFQIGTTNLNLWLCYKRDYWQLGCKNRTVKIDIQNEDIDIISINTDSMILEIDLSVVEDSNSGLGDIQNTIIDLDSSIKRSDRVCIEPSGCVNVSPRLVFSYALTANKINEDKNGGGLRVKQLELSDGNTSTFTNYYYNEEGYDKSKDDVNYKSSGITSYTPSKIFKEIKFISELPSPSVLYNRVTVENTGEDQLSDSKTVYKFRTLNTNSLIDTNNEFTIPNLLEIKTTQSNNTSLNVNSETSEVYAKSFEIKSNWSALGQLISKEVINNENQTIFKNVNKYSVFSESIQGVNQESFDVYKESLSDDYKYFITTTSRINYSNALENVSTTQGGLNITKYYDKYDFLTGQVLESRIYASNGVAYKTKLIPAYSKYEEMDSKVDNENYANMLTQVAGSYTFLDKDGDWQPIGVNITTWNNDWSYLDYTGDEQTVLEDKGPDIWRKHKNYVWKGALNEDGTFKDYSYSETNDDSFKWGLGESQTNSKWQEVSETTRYDHFSMTLESKDINGNYVATKMGDNNSKVIAVCNAAYSEMYYSGAEYTVNGSDSNSLGYFDGQVKSTYEVEVGEANAHTGTHIVSLTYNNEKGFEVNLPANPERVGKKQKFKVSVWAKKDNAINARILVGTSEKFFSSPETVYAGDWVLLNGYITIPSGETSVSIVNLLTGSKLDLDDFRLYPVSSSMTSYVYNEWDELWCIIGSNGLATKFEYDEAGRLEKTYKEVVDYKGPGTGGFRKVSENNYNYKKRN